jgi:hypothetical protein
VDNAAVTHHHHPAGRMTMADDRTFLQRVEDRQREINGTHDQPPTPLTPIIYDLGDNEDGRRRAYAQKALRDECDLVAFAIEGTRNDALNRAAFNIARFVADGILAPEYVDSELVIAARACGLPESEIRATLRSAIAGSAAKPRTQPAVPPARTGGAVTEVNADTLAGTIDDTHHPVWGTHPPADGAAYLFDQDDTAISLWGANDLILWAEGEALMIAGGMGLGKTTLAGQIVRAQIGLDTTVLGMPVAPVDGPILYLAMDRPRQIRRSMLRQFDYTERDQIAGRLLIRPGPPIADLAVRPTLLAEMARECGAAVVYVDSLKDAAIGLSSDEVGAAYNRARQFTLANNVQLCELHHLIKRNPLGGQPNTVADVYGSNWLTAGAGSVVMLTGEPGDPIVGFRHAKQPHNEVGPWRLLHDPDRGRFTIDHEVDLLTLAADTGATGLTPQGAAAAIFEKDKPSRAQIEKARRRLDKLAAAGQLTRIEGMRGGAVDGVKGSISANYFSVS